MYRHALRGLSLSSSFLGTSCFAAAAASSPYPSFFSEFLWTTMCNSVEHSASGTFHCLAAARPSISLAVAPASREFLRFFGNIFDVHHGCSPSKGMKTSPKAVKRQPTMLTPFPVSRGSSESRAIMGFSRGWPFSERPPEIDELAEMIGVVVRHEQRFAQDRLAVPMGNPGEQIGLRILHETDHFLEISHKCLHGLVPRGLIRRPRRCRPVPFGKSGGNMLGIAAEFQDVPLRDPRMFQELPAGMRQSRYKGSAFGLGEALDGVHEMDVRAAAFQKIDEVFAQCPIVAARSGLLACRFGFFPHGDSYFSESRTCCGTSGTGCKVVLANPALPN